MKDLFKTTTLLLIMAAIFAGCNKQPSNAYNETAEKEKFCSFVNIKNIDKTIPIVNEFLSRLSAGLDDEQQLQILVTWLQSCTCIVDAAVLSQPGNETLPVSEILISFDENGITKELIMDVLMEKPLKITEYRKYEPPVEYEFCMCLNDENIEQTIPIINEFLSGLPDEMDNEQKLNGLVAWLNLRHCVIDAVVLCRSCDWRGSELFISFAEKGVTKKYTFFVSNMKIYGSFIEQQIDETSCRWKNYDEEGLILINSYEQLDKYITCADCDYPVIDFSKNTLLLAKGVLPNRTTIGAKMLRQLDHKYYELGVESTPPYIYDVVTYWHVAIIINKINADSIVDLKSYGNAYLNEIP